ncbi:unnamed protein product [Protopolystoma xenopodis]|uniref:Uncharacterized protein n=1 Tax=Protopolystoma xenopodis TaxID=117903 RepID=A0A3S5B850_9PLAT|nr:unnamed protein product [Protopolystoma xenopodis]
MVYPKRSDSLNLHSSRSTTRPSDELKARIVGALSSRTFVCPQCKNVQRLDPTIVFNNRVNSGGSDGQFESGIESDTRKKSIEAEDREEEEGGKRIRRLSSEVKRLDSTGERCYAFFTSVPRLDGERQGGWWRKNAEPQEEDAGSATMTDTSSCGYSKSSFLRKALALRRGNSRTPLTGEEDKVVTHDLDICKNVQLPRADCQTIEDETVGAEDDVDEAEENCVVMAAEGGGEGGRTTSSVSRHSQRAKRVSSGVASFFRRLLLAQTEEEVDAIRNQTEACKSDLAVVSLF